MTKHCFVSHCTEPTAGYSTLCESHKRALRRHGDALQDGVTARELKSFIERIAIRKKKNPTNPAWQLLRDRWDALAAHAEATLDGYADGSIAISYERQTAEQLIALRKSVPVDTVMDTALAMFLLLEQRPNRFVSDKAFNFQLARRVRSLTKTNSASHYSLKEGRFKRTYKDAPPKVLNCLAESLKAAFGVAGMRLAELEKKDAEGLKAEKQQFHDALKEMT
jgi:hypothetical protein